MKKQFILFCVTLIAAGPICFAQASPSKSDKSASKETAITDFAALEVRQKLFAFGNLYVLLLPKNERIDRGAGIAAAVRAMTIAHVEWRAVHFQHNCSAIAGPCMCL